MDTRDLVRVIVAPNPGPMTLDGTNTYLLGEPDALVVVDPGPELSEHAQRVASAGRIALILITHHHADHTGGSAELHRLTGAPVRALDPAYCHAGDTLAPDEVIEAGPLRIRVLTTPGHTADSVSFIVTGGAGTAVLTGDTILGRGTTVLIHGDGSLAAYLDSLDRIAALGPVLGLPAHGPEIPDLAAVCAELTTHRLERLEQIRAALQTLQTDATAASVNAVTDVVYAEVDPAVRFAAEASVATQLEYLRERP